RPSSPLPESHAETASSWTRRASAARPRPCLPSPRATPSLARSGRSPSLPPEPSPRRAISTPPASPPISIRNRAPLPPRVPSAAVTTPYATEAYLHQILGKALAAQASDVHLKVGQPPGARVRGDMMFFRVEKLRAEDTDAVARILLGPKEPLEGLLD